MAKEGRNWQGLLKWSLSHADGTNSSRNLSEFKEAMRSQTLVKRMKEITLVMQTPEQFLESQGVTPDDIEGLLDELQEHVESIDMANDLHSIGGLVPLLAYLKNSHAIVKAKAAEVVSTLVQNNPRSQQLVMEANGLDLLLSNFTSDPDVVVRTKALGAISSLIRHNETGITAFRLAKGYAGLRDALSSENARFQRKARNLIHHLLLHDSDIVTELGSCRILTHLGSSEDPEVREAALTDLLDRSYKSDTTSSTEEDEKLKQIPRERIIIRIRETAEEKEGKNWKEKKEGEMEGRSDAHGQQQQQQGEQEEMWILVCALHSVDKGRDDKGRLRCRRVDFHLVDLKGDMILCNFLPSMYTHVGRGEMMSMGSFIYILSDLHVDDDQPLALEPLHKYHYHMNASRLDLEENSNCWCWEPAVLPVTNSASPSCVSMLGKMYSFGYPRLINPQVYDPRVGQWKELGSLPSHLVDSKVSFQVLPDPANHRILVHLSGGNHHLYAFYPPKDVDVDHFSTGGKWVCITTEMIVWKQVATVADDIIYFHDLKFPSIVRAYDIATGKWLRVVWSSVFIDDADISLCQFDALFSCPGKGMLCLATWMCLHTKPINTSVDFLKFRVERTSDSTLTLTPLRLQSYHIASTDYVFDFLPL